MTKNDATDVYFVLEFEGETTGPILAHDSTSCDSTQSEVQKISTSTSGERGGQSLYFDNMTESYVLYSLSGQLFDMSISDNLLFKLRS